MTEMRKDRRAPASLKVKYKSATVDDFIEQFGTDVSRGGIFIKTKKPLEAGALLKFEFQLQDGSAVLHGVGRVAWRRLEQQARPDLPAGMGIKFFKLSDHSRIVVERIESRYSGNKSRYEVTDSAEFAPPLSGPPPATESHSGPLPGNGKRLSLGASGSAPRTLPPPPAVSSIPPALKDVPVRVPSGPIRPSMRNANAALPKGTASSFFPETPTRKQQGVPPRSSGTPANRARDASEFLASAFHAGGAGPEVRAQAKAQAERARRDPESVDLARELFGDMGDSPAAPATSPGQVMAAPPAAASESEAHTAPTHRPPASVSGNPNTFPTPVPAVELPRSVPPRASGPSFADKIPSIEQLVDDAGRTEAVAPSGRARSGGAAAPASVRPPQRAPEENLAATQSIPFLNATSKPPDAEPLKLAMSVPPARAALSTVPPGRTRTLLLVALSSTLVLGGVAGYIVMQRNAAQHADHAQAELENAQATPSIHDEPQPAAAAEPTQPAAAPAAPTPGPEVAVAVSAKPNAAEVWIGGDKKGVAPFSTKLPSNVPVEVSVKSPGFATLTRTITPKEGAAPESFELTPLPYEVVITTEPAGGTIAFAGKSAVSPAPLELGHLDTTVSVTADKEGFLRATRALKLDEFHEQNGVMRAEITLPLVARRRVVAAPARPAAPAPGSSINDAPPEPSAPPPPVVQVKPTTEPPPQEAPPAAATPEPEAKAKPAEPEKTAAAPEPPPPPEPAAN